MQKVLDRFTTLIKKKFPASSSIELMTYKPTSTIPLGGNSAQCAIIVSSSLPNGRQSAESVLGRLLQRTISPGAGGIATPPSHFIVLSSLGTERTDKFPYALQNTFGGGKLDKQRDVEEVVISTVKGRMVAEGARLGDASRDYTIIKFGEVVEDSKVKKGKDDNGFVKIRPGDTLDGNVGVEAAANVLLQALAFQPNARNSTMSVVGGIAGDETAIDGVKWGDDFLRLDGPELWRMEEDDVWTPDGKGSEEGANRVFEKLANYLGEWSLVFDNGAKGTGLTTPVNVKPDTYLMNSSTTKWSVRLEFKPTFTGSAYKSKDEERELERQGQTSPSSSTPNKKFKNTKQQKEGGIEVLVEKTFSNDSPVGIRVRAKRCNMDDFTVIKELSEETILKRLQEAMVVWKKQ